MRRAGMELLREMRTRRKPRYFPETQKDIDATNIEAIKAEKRRRQEEQKKKIERKRGE